MKITFIEADGSHRVVDGKLGDTLMQAAVNAGVPGILGECGGSCSCATCHVYIEPPWDSACGELRGLEKEMIELTPAPSACSRLACQIALMPEYDGLVVRIANNQL